MINPSVERWADARVRWIETRQGPFSLDVGPHKPLGSLGFAVPNLDALRPLGQALRRQPLRVHLAAFGADGIERRWLAGRFSEMDPLWVYAWHGPSLRAVLRRHAGVLRAAGLSTDPKVFVPAHRVLRAPVQSPLFDAIADAYGDTLNPGRRDVLYGVDRQDLLRALRARGHGDPSFAFLPDSWQIGLDRD